MSNRNLCRSISTLVTAALLSLPGLSMAQTVTWDGDTDSLWAIGTNWVGGAAPLATETAIFNGAGNGNAIDLGVGGQTIGSVLFDTADAAGYTIGSGAVGSQTLTLGTLAGGIQMNSTVANNQLINANLALSTTGTYTVGLTNNSTTNSLTVAGGISASTAGAKVLTVTGAGNTTVSGSITNGTGTIGLTKSGAGTLTLSGASNAITGALTVNAGVVDLSTDLGLGGGVLVAGTGGAINSTGGGRILLNSAGGDLGVSNGGTLTINAVIANGTQNSIDFWNVTNGTGVVVLTAANTFSGTTSLQSGVISVGTIGNSGVSGNLGQNGTFHIGATSSAATLRYTGTGETNDRVINLSGTTGGATIDQSGTGLLKFTSALTATGAGAKTLTLQGSTAGTGELAGAIVDNTTTNRTSVTKVGTGTWTLSGANTYTGGTRINAGTTVFSGSHTYSGTNTDFLSLNNVGAQNAVLKITAGSHGFYDMPIAEAANSRGAVFQSAGTLTLNRPANVATMRLGGGTGSYGYYNLSGGTLTSNEIGIGAGNDAVGVMDVTGGTFTQNGFITIGRGGLTSSGVLNVTGGTVTAARIHLDYAATAGATSVLNVGGGGGAATVSTTGSTTLGLDLANANNAGTLGIANLRTNGTLTTGIVTATSANPTTLLNFNGGTLKATTTNAGANFLTSANVDAVTVYSGGGTIDNNGTNITVSKALGAATGNGVTSIAVTNGGSGYIGAPMVKITGGTGNTATGYAVMVDDGTGNGTYKVDSIVITSAGTYTVDPTTVTLTGGGASTAATLGSITTAANTSGGMSFAGTGTTTLSGANTYTGGTTISSGTLSVGGAGQLGGGTYAGNISNGGAFIFASSATQTLSGVISGTGALSKTTGAGTLTLSGANTYTGNTTVSAGTLLLDTTGSLTFAIGNNGVNTKITGSGILTLDGTFNFDFSGAAISNGNMWTIVDSGTLAESYLSNFAIAGFTQASDIWTRIDGSNTWTFEENTGILSLSVVPEPNSWLLALGGMTFFAVSRRRRRIA